MSTYGGQSDLSIFSYDNIYCVLYSVYAGLLFIINFDILNKRTEIV